MHYTEKIGLRLVLANFGVFYIDCKNVKIKDFEPSYKGVKPANFVRAPIHVSNHVSYRFLFKIIK